MAVLGAAVMGKVKSERILIVEMKFFNDRLDEELRMRISIITRCWVKQRLKRHFDLGGIASQTTSCEYLF